MHEEENPLLVTHETFIIIIIVIVIIYYLSKEKPQNFLHQNKSKYCNVTLRRAKGKRENFQKLNS